MKKSLLSSFIISLVFIMATDSLNAKALLKMEAQEVENAYAIDGINSDWDKIKPIAEECDRLQKAGQITKMGQYYVNKVKNWKSNDGDFLYALAKFTDEVRNNLNKYNWSLAATANMYNAANIMAESYTLSMLDVELNGMRVLFAVQAAQLGNEDAEQLLQIWNIQAQINNPSNGNNAINQSNNNNYRKKQLLDNIATYEKRIREIESQKGTGIATNMMGNQTIANYKRMIEEAKRELRSMGHNIY